MSTVGTGSSDCPAPRATGHAATQPPALSYIPELDGLRAIAVILVLINHYVPTSIASMWRLKAVGWVGVDLFFVLSGFLITRILIETRTRETYYRDFYVRRTLRIFPLYYCVLVVIFSAMLLWHHGAAYRELAHWGNPLWSWLYLENVQIVMLDKAPRAFSLVPLWSLHVEEQFYLLFPLVVRLMSPRALVKVLVGVVVGAPLLRLVLWWLDPGNQYVDYMLLPCRFDALALGALIAIRIKRPIQIDRRLLGALTIGAATVVYVLFATLGHNLWNDPFTRVWGYSLFPAAFGCMVLWIVRYRGSWQTNWLNAAPLQFVGKTSYAIYLLQAPVAGALGVLLGSTLIWSSDVIRFVLICATTIGLAALSWRFLERPLLQLKERFAPAKPPAAEHAETAAGTAA